jgi:hypothetical protein
METNANKYEALAAAVNDFLCNSSRYCELSDKAKATGLIGDEAQEFAAIRAMYRLTEK